jgi:hypothetical protein
MRYSWREDATGRRRLQIGIASAKTPSGGANCNSATHVERVLKRIFPDSTLERRRSRIRERQ